MLIDLKIFNNFENISRLFKGGYVCESNEIDSILSQANGDKGNYSYKDSYFEVDNQLYSYGVIDSPDQFLKKFGERLDQDERKFIVRFSHIGKYPECKGKGGGWRWHKWGEYHGDGQPEHEYLDDEDGFPDGVWIFNIYTVYDKFNEQDYYYFDIALEAGYVIRYLFLSSEKALEGQAASKVRAEELKIKVTYTDIQSL